MTVVNKYHHSSACPHGSVNIMRGTPFGNPYRVNMHGNRQTVIQKFSDYLEKRIAQDPAFREQVRNLYGLDLCCVCAPLPCHGDVLEDVAARLQTEWKAAQPQKLNEHDEELVGLFGEIKD